MKIVENTVSRRWIVEAKMEENQSLKLWFMNNISDNISFHLHFYEQMSTSSHFFFFIFFILLWLSPSVTDATQVTIINNCKESIWPGILGTAGQPTPNHGGFRLHSGQQELIQLPHNWSGRIWGRQGCCFDKLTGKGSCQTGDCTGLLHCAGAGGQPPATLVEMTFGTSNSPLHYYDVSLIDGFNVPISMAAGNSRLGCEIAACEADLNQYCPFPLIIQRKNKVVGCKSACLATNSDRHCCRGQFSDQKSCKPTLFGLVFKAICPKAYSFPFDEHTGLKTCRASSYVITFCPSSSN